MPADSQQLVAYGKVLQEAEKTLGEYNIKDGDFLVVMVKKVRFLQVSKLNFCSINRLNQLLLRKLKHLKSKNLKQKCQPQLLHLKQTLLQLPPLSLNLLPQILQQPKHNNLSQLKMPLRLPQNKKRQFKCLCQSQVSHVKFVFRLSLLLLEIPIEHSNILTRASPPKHPHSLVLKVVSNNQEQQVITKERMMTSATKKEVLNPVHQE